MEVWTLIFPLIVGVTFVLSGLVINVIQLFLFVLIRPIHRELYIKLLSLPIRCFYGQIVFLFEYHSRSTIKCYIDPEELKLIANEKLFYIVNHHFEFDWMIPIVFANKIGSIGYSRAFMKTSLMFLPIVGWFWKLSDYICLQRSFEKDREVIAKRLGEVFNTNHPVKILFYAEGTRLTPKKLEDSIKFAEGKGLEPLKYHLFPRTKGFKVCVPMLKKHCNAVLNFEMCFEEDRKDVTLINIFLGQQFNVHVRIKRIPTADLPDDEQEIENFLYKLYQEKDEWQESFRKNKNFNEISEHKAMEFKRPRWILYNQIFWIAVVVTPMILHLINLLLLGLYANFFIKIGVVCVILLVFVQQSLDVGRI